MKGEPCKRKRIVINGENFYKFQGKTFVDCTTSYENRPENLKLRQAVDTLCEEISKDMEAQVELDKTVINQN